MMVLTFNGVRSGKTCSFPIGYAEEPDGQLTFTRFSWWRNFREKPVSLRLRGREVQGTAVAVRDPEVVAERFACYLKRNPHDGTYFGVRVGRDGRTDPGGGDPRRRQPGHDPKPVGRNALALMGGRRGGRHGTSMRLAGYLREARPASRLPLVQRYRTSRVGAGGAHQSADGR